MLSENPEGRQMYIPSLSHEYCPSDDASNTGDVKKYLSVAMPMFLTRMYSPSSVCMQYMASRLLRLWVLS